MHTDLARFEQYCQDVLGVKPRTQPWPNAMTLPQFMRQAYDFYQLKLLDLTCLLAADRIREERPPAVIRKQLTQVGQKWNQPVVYLRDAVTSYNRQRLIKHQVPFVVPGNQMYLPMLGMDFRERFHPVERMKPAINPSTQVLLLYFLLQGKEGPFTPGKMAQVLHYAPMTMTRAFAELARLGIGEHIARKRDRRVSFPVRGKLLWEQVAPHMRTPVRKRFFVGGNVDKSNLLVAGITALEKYSMISGPATPVYAAGPKRWKEIAAKTTPLPFAETGTLQVEAWTYPPELLARNAIVDQFSLFLSLREEKDERIATALETILDKMPW